MRCSVPCCRNRTDNVSVSEGKGAITFYGFPSEVHLRAAWLRALSNQDVDLQNGAVVCSQHFLDDEMYKTDSGLVQILPGAIPSTIQVCMICLDTDRKLVLMSKYKLEEVYEKLTGHPLFDPGNLKQTVCILCAQRLRNFKTFRAKSLRARSLMMDLVEKYVLVTNEHVRKINSVKNHLQYNFVQTTLGTDHCDFYIVEPDETKHIKTEEAHDEIVIVKNEKDDNECNKKTYIYTNNADDSFVLPSEDYSISDGNTQLDVKQLSLCNGLPSSLTASTLDCATQFTIKHESDHLSEEYNQYNMNMHQQIGDVSGNGTAHVWEADAAASSSSDSIHAAENKLNIEKLTDHASPDFGSTFVTTTHANTTQKKSDSDNQPSDSNTQADQNAEEISHCVVKVCDIFTNTLIVPKREGSPAETRNANNICDSPDIDISKELIYRPSKSEISATQSKPERLEATQKSLEFSNELMINFECDSNSEMNSSLHNRLLIEKKQFTCSICCNTYNRKSTLAKHIKKIHAEMKQLKTKAAILKLLTCKVCQYKTRHKYHFTVHMRIHTGEKPYSCELCKYKCVSNSRLVVHMRTHTGEKPFKCKLCEYRSVKKSDLVQHMRTHTGEKPYTCELCKHKFSRTSSLAKHRKTHTGEKPHSCDTCDYKCARSSDLVRHMRIHTGEKPYSCALCKLTFSYNSGLAKHMKTHVGEMP